MRQTIGAVLFFGPLLALIIWGFIVDAETTLFTLGVLLAGALLTGVLMYGLYLMGAMS